MEKDPIKWQKHLEVCKLYRENNREKYRKNSLESARRKKAKNPDEYKKVMDERAKRYRENNLEEYQVKEKEKSRLRRLQDPEKERKYLRERYLRVNYGITQETYDEMYRNQEGKCAICKTDFRNDVKKGFVDHDHITGKVRGLLCSPCNIVLGYVDKIRKINPEILHSFIEYLK